MIKSHVLYRLSYALPDAHLGHRRPLSKPKPLSLASITRWASRWLTSRTGFGLLPYPGGKM